VAPSLPRRAAVSDDEAVRRLKMDEATATRAYSLLETIVETVSK